MVNTMLAHVVTNSGYTWQVIDNVYNTLCDAGVGCLPVDVFGRHIDRPTLPYIKWGLSAELHKQPGFHI